jgi:hypothetical protein
VRALWIFGGAWPSAAGRCFDALRDLEAAGHFVLPARLNTGHWDSVRPTSLAVPLATPTAGLATVMEVQGLQRVVVETDDQRRIWQRLMQGEHPQGAGALVAAQPCYPIASEHGWLGGYGFAASALHLLDRDRWIGWDDATRRDRSRRHQADPARFSLCSTGPRVGRRLARIPQVERPLACNREPLRRHVGGLQRIRHLPPSGG